MAGAFFGGESVVSVSIQEWMDWASKQDAKHHLLPRTFPAKVLLRFRYGLEKAST